MKSEFCYVFWTCKNVEEAKKIARGLLEKRLIACASMWPVESIYTWEKNIEEGKEIKVILKTRGERFEEVREFIVNHCSYEVPEILQVAIEKGNPKYLKWVLEGTK